VGIGAGVGTSPGAILCLPVTIEPLCLANVSDTSNSENDYSFGQRYTRFGVDNCATHHICSEKSLFIGVIRPCTNIGVRGIAGSAIAEGIGTIAFTLTDSKDQKHHIEIENVIYLPSAAKNLVSVSQWSADKQDDAGVSSKQQYSIFSWGNEEYSKFIPHQPDCLIPLMAVNESEDIFATFVDTHSE